MTLEQVQQLLVSGGLMSSETVEQQMAAWRGEGGSAEDGGGFVDFLSRQELITDFQARAVRGGVEGPYHLGPYEVFDRIAAGRQGHIFRGLHEVFDQRVCLKFFRSAGENADEQARRIAQETRVAVQIDHPHAVRAFQVGRIEKVVFIAIEDLHGETLESKLKREGKLAPLEAARLILDLAEALEHIHGLDIVLRDIRPADIWVTEEGRGKLMEFGASRDPLSEGDDVPYNPLHDAELYGDLDYLAPEQGACPPAAHTRSDLYALGCVFYRCLTGSVVFPDVNPVRKMLRQALEAPPQAHDVDHAIPATISDIVNTLLAKQSNDRFHTASDLVWALSQRIESEERQAALQAEINPDFLAWAEENAELEAGAGEPAVVAQPEFIDFLSWIATHTPEPTEHVEPVPAERGAYEILAREHARLKLDADGHVVSVELELTHVNDYLLEQLAKLHRLDALALRRTNLHDSGLTHLSQLTSLRWLSLNKTHVSDAGLMHLAGLNNLEWLFLADTRVTDLGVTRLHAALPECDIRR